MRLCFWWPPIPGTSGEDLVTFPNNSLFCDIKQNERICFFSNLVLQYRFSYTFIIQINTVNKTKIKNMNWRSEIVILSPVSYTVARCDTRRLWGEAGYGTPWWASSLSRGTLLWRPPSQSSFLELRCGYKCSMLRTCVEEANSEERTWSTEDGERMRQRKIGREREIEW